MILAVLASWAFVVFMAYLALSLTERGASRHGRSPERRIVSADSSLRAKASGSVSFPQLVGFFALTVGSILFWLWAVRIMPAGSAPQAGVLLVLEPLAAVLVASSGLALLRGWRKGPTLYLIASGLLIFTVILAVTSPEFRASASNTATVTWALLSLASLHLVGVVYGWEHFVLGLDQRENTAELAVSREAPAAPGEMAEIIAAEEKKRAA
jgi:hypothetical protein